MQTIEYRWREDERKEWGPGPWDNEVDKRQWLDLETGLPCLIVRGPMGAWCGYVGVPEGHPCFQLGYDQVHGYNLESDNYEGPCPDLSVHGGLTFADFCAPDGKEHGICHIVEPGENDRVWWLGFDCGHAFDLVPRMMQHERDIPELAAIKAKAKEDEDRLREQFGDNMPYMFGREVYRDEQYVTKETLDLARQLAAATHAGVIDVEPIDEVRELNP